MRISGLVSGFDWHELVDSLMKLEAQPVVAAKNRQALTQQRLQAWEGLKSDLQSLRTTLQKLRQPADFRGMQASSSDGDAVNVTLNSGAQAGSYNIKVTQLATAYSAHTSDTLNISAGTFTLQDSSAAEATEIEVTADDTAESVRDKINEASIGIKAAVIDGHLALTREATGTGSITITDTNNVLGSTWTTSAGTNAEIEINGIQIERGSNYIDDAIPGVKLDLLKVTNDNVTIAVHRDIEGVAAQIQGFVEQYNQVWNKINSLYSYDASGDGSKNGPLSGDTTLSRLMTSLRRAVMDPVAIDDPSFNHLRNWGIDTEGKSGTLKIDPEKLEQALTENFDQVVRFFTTPEVGFAARVDSLIANTTGTNGTADSRIKYFQNMVKDYDRQIQSLEDRLAMRERGLLARFQLMESMMSQFQAQSGFLDQFIAQNMLKN